MKHEPLIRTCREATLEHRRAIRQYAHTFHYPNTICVARDFWDLPHPFKKGILYHELGHLAGAKREDHADQLAWEIYGVKVQRVDSEFGDNLEYAE